MQAKTETKAMQCGPDCQFRFRILAPNPGHHLAAHIRRHSVGGQWILPRLKEKGIRSEAKVFRSHPERAIQRYAVS